MDDEMSVFFKCECDIKNLILNVCFFEGLLCWMEWWTRGRQDLRRVLHHSRHLMLPPHLSARPEVPKDGRGA
jgi:hypothetical protein